MTTTATKERPILFSGPMVRAILDGRKTQTRRVLKYAETIREGWYPDRYNKTADWTFWGPRGSTESGKCTLPLFRCPYGEPGDVLWVRETWWQAHHYPGLDQSGEATTDTGSNHIHYAADGDPKNTPNRHYPSGLRGGAISAPDPYAIWFKRPSIFMPRWACRIKLEITDVRVERVKEITHDDAVAEGCYRIEPCEKYPNGNAWGRAGYAALWNEINGERGYGWESNPWVWALSFRRVNSEGHQS